MIEIKPIASIAGVRLVHLQAFADPRGRFAEFFRKEWFPERSWEIVQCNRSESSAGVLRGLHYHHRQVDYWHLAQGEIRVGLVDLRRNSPTYKAAQVLELSDTRLEGLYIPIGVAHGFFTVRQATLFYIVDSYFDGSDEFGLAWNDPSFNLNWDVNDPLLSERDRSNPRFEQITERNLPPI